MKFKVSDRIYTAGWWRSWIMVFTGSAILAAAFVLFINPYRIVPGGVYGTGIVLHALFPSVQVGTFGLMLDIPLLLIAFRIFGGMFGAKTVFAAVVTPVVMNTMTYILGEDPATMLGGRIDLTNDIIIACLFGGVLVGIGIGLIIKTRATSGGTDIIAMIITKYTHLTFSRSILLVDSMVVIFGIIVLGDWRLPLYSLVTIFVMSRTIDFVIDGASYDKLLFIISDKHESMRSFILDEMGRGATYIKSSGMYTGNDKEMIFLVVSRREVTTVQNKIRELDPLSFVVVVDAYETFGDGFKSFPVEADGNG
ncbi:MAG: YitT family protein [Alistipes sp.]|nr:YitT family protein [Alistipes sp.]